MDILTKHSSDAINLVYQGADQVLRSLEHTVPNDILRDFIQTVNWREPFILALLAAQGILWLFAIYTRRNDVYQFLLLSILAGVTVNAQRLNDFGKANWQRFATQDYFDSNGTFLLIFLLAPFVLLANIIVVRFPALFLPPFCCCADDSRY